ncbi:hypothetical protein [Mesobacterium pallidum]|uniref:hypothetical protein n=1 Tax=Mesobacterium pallidum TaxID=2872037 RepID=UPI001EE36BDD|nr:hypothetical protein [Mesobacterium pallidum]
MIFALTAPLGAQEPLPTPLPRALSGDTVLVDGKVIRLEGRHCPNIRSEEGLEAKRLVTAMLTARHVECFYRQEPDGSYVGDCRVSGSPLSLVRGNSVAQALAKRHLCDRYGRS